MKKIVLFLIGAVFFISLTETVQAQWAVGASYEIRDEKPKNGFGLRLEKDFLSSVPLLDFRLRGHFSYFNDTNNLEIGSVDISGDFDAYDFGLAAITSIGIGIVDPYIGFGIGRERYKFSPDEMSGGFKDSSFYWNGFGGAEVSLLPFLKPFIEYRISHLTSLDDVDFDNVGRFAIGVNLRF